MPFSHLLVVLHYSWTVQLYERLGPAHFYTHFMPISKFAFRSAFCKVLAGLGLYPRHAVPVPSLCLKNGIYEGIRCIWSVPFTRPPEHHISHQRRRPPNHHIQPSRSSIQLSARGIHSLYAKEQGGDNQESGRMAGLKTALLAWLAVSAGARQTGPPTGAPAAPGRAGGAGNWTDVDLLQLSVLRASSSPSSSCVFLLPFAFLFHASTTELP